MGYLPAMSAVIIAVGPGSEELAASTETGGAKN